MSSHLRLLDHLSDFSDGAAPSARRRDAGFVPLVRPPERRRAAAPAAYQALAATLAEDAPAAPATDGEIAFCEEPKDEPDELRFDPLPVRPRDAAPPAPAAEPEIEAEPAARVDEAAMEELRREHAAEIAALHERYGNEIAERIAASIAAAEQELAMAACESVVDVLGPVLDAELVRRSVEALARRLRDIAGSGGALRIELKGPRDLHDRLVEAIGDDPPPIAFTEDDGPELVMEVDSQIVRTRIGEWMASVKEFSR